MFPFSKLLSLHHIHPSFDGDFFILSLSFSLSSRSLWVSTSLLSSPLPPPPRWALLHPVKKGPGWAEPSLAALSNRVEAAWGGVLQGPGRARRPGAKCVAVQPAKLLFAMSWYEKTTGEQESGRRKERMKIQTKISLFRAPY